MSGGLNSDGECFIFIDDEGLKDAPWKLDLASLEHPIFALTAGDMNVFIYKHNDCTITVNPGTKGRATMHDKELWIYCIARLIQLKNQGQPVAKTVRFSAYNFLKCTGRGVSGRAYRRMGEMLARLTGTRIETNLESSGKKQRGFFGLVDAAKISELDGAVAVEVTLPDWLMRSIDSLKVLTLDREYFNLRSPLTRRIYELARKHCGSQQRFKISMRLLQKKSGSVSSLREFRSAIKKLVETRELPGYRVSIGAKDMVIFQHGADEGTCLHPHHA